MAKEKEIIKLRPVDEEAEKVRRYLRLHPDTVEEVEELPPVRIGEGQTPEARQEEGIRPRIRTRSNEPDIGSLIEKGEILPEGQWESSPAHMRKLPWGWVALVGCIFAGGILWSLVSVTRSEKKQDLLVDQTERIVESSMQEEREAERMVTAIEAAVWGFFGSGSVGEMLNFVRHPQRVAPLMEDYYADNPLAPLRLEKIMGMAPLTVDNQATFWIASCQLEGRQVAQILVEAVSSEEAKVDWETYVNYQPMDWDDFARSRPGGYTGDFRVYAELDSFYSHEFSDSGTYSSFRLTALKGEEALNGYTPRGGAVEQRLMELIQRNGGGATPVILRLHLPEGLDSKRGVFMEKLVCPRWVFVDSQETEDP